MARAPRVRLDDDGFQIASDAGDLADNQDVSEDVDLDDDDFEEDEVELSDVEEDVEDDDDVEEDDVDEDDEEDDEDDEDEGLAASSVPKVTRDGKGKKQTAKDRIAELAERRRAAEAEAFEAEMALQDERRARQALEERIAALEAGGPAPSTNVPKRPDPKDFKYGEADDDYIEAVVEHRLAEERAKFQQTQQSESEREANARKLEEYKRRYAEFAKEGTKRFGKEYEKTLDSVKFPGPVAKDVLDSSYGVDIGYYLATNISKLREISQMTDVERAKEIGRLEQRFSARASAGKKRTKAPETPNRKGKRAASKVDAKYGPENQDDFDRAFFGR